MKLVGRQFGSFPVSERDKVTLSNENNIVIGSSYCQGTYESVQRNLTSVWRRAQRQPHLEKL